MISFLCFSDKILQFVFSTHDYYNMLNKKKKAQVITKKEVLEMMNRNEKMMNACRRAVSTVAGVDRNTAAEVASMRLRSESAGNQTNEMVNSFMNECKAARRDYSF